MTFAFKGRVHSLTQIGPNIKVAFIAETEIADDPILLVMGPMHASAYLPGTPVQFTVCPLLDASAIPQATVSSPQEAK